MAKNKGSPLRTRQPLVYAALAFSAGILLAVYAWRPLTWWLGACVLVAASALYFVRQRLWFSRVLALLIWTMLGALSIELRAGTPIPEIDQFLTGKEVTVTAHVLRDGNFRQAGFGGIQQSIDVRTEQVEMDGRTSQVAFGLRLNVYGKGSTDRGPGEPSSTAAMPVFEYGQRLRARAKLRWPRNYRNPGAFNYVAYLSEKGIVAQGAAKADSVEVLPGLAGTSVQRWRSRIHRNILQKVDALWPAKQAALMNAMVIGDDAFIQRDTRADFQRSGTYHILVVSGMNVGILAFVLFWILRRLRVGDIIASVLVVAFSIGYALLTDVGPPIWRATLMLALYLGVRLFYRDRSMLNAIGGAALGLLVLDPKALLGASFQLTFLSVLIIGAIGLPVLERTSEPYKKGLRELNSCDYDAHLPPAVAQFRLDLRMISGRIARFIGKRTPLPAIAYFLRASLSAFETLLISALMQIALALPMAWYFHRATVMGLPANLFVIPLTGILMPAAVAAVALSYVSVALASIPAFVAGLALDGITLTVRWVGALRVADWRVPQPAPLVAVAACIALLATMILVRRRASAAATALAMLSCSALWIAGVPPRPVIKRGLLEMTAIDVGQADSTLLITPGGSTILVDAGGPLGGMRSEFGTGEDVVSPYLWSRGISRLDAVIITHAHSDHIGGMHAILGNFRPRELWIGAAPSNASVSALLDEARELGITVVQHRAGDRFAFGPLDVNVLWPPVDWPSRPQATNEDSLVLRFGYRNSALLLEGDADRKIERSVIPFVERVDLLKVAHNGSATSTDPLFLATLKPRWAAISVGAHNSFGHPRRDVLQRLESSGVRVHRTDMEGAVSFYLDGEAPLRPGALR